MLTEEYVFRREATKRLTIKGIFQPFELGGVTRLIRSAVKFWKAGNLKFFFNDTISREELKTN